MHRQIVKTYVLCGGFAAALAAGACNRGEEPKAVSDAQTQTAQPANQPLTVAGCLKAGDAENTFVLTAARTDGSGETGTYQLVGSPNVNLRDHLGHRVEVHGTVEAQQEIASRTTAQAPADNQPTGTSGAPKVETKTELDIKRVSVDSVKPLDEKCEL
jgi:hypothetical protein